jgi:hypothetical protein
MMAVSKRRFYAGKRPMKDVHYENNSPIETTFPTPMMPFADNDVGPVTQTECQRMWDPSKSGDKLNSGGVVGRRSFEHIATRPFAKYKAGPNGQVANGLQDERTKITKSGGFSGRL